MTAPRIDLEEIARELGITPEQVSAHLLDAIAAGLLRVTDVDGEQVTLEGVLADEVAQ